MGIFLFSVIALCLLGWVIFTQVGGRQQLVVHVPYPVDVARSVVRQSFGPMWNGNVAGRGADNFRPRLRYRPPTLSIDYQPTEDGGCEVQIWTSEWWSVLGGLVMQHATLMWRKRLYVARKLDGAKQMDLAAGP